MRKTILFGLLGFLLLLNLFISTASACITISNPTTISSSGCYVLGSDISANENQDALTITTENVSINLNGHSLIGFHSGSTTHYALYLKSNSNSFKNITIENGNIIGQVKYYEGNHQNSLDYMKINFTNVKLTNSYFYTYTVRNGYYFNFKNCVIENTTFNYDTSSLFSESSTHQYKGYLKFYLENSKILNSVFRGRSPNREDGNNYFQEIPQYTPNHCLIFNTTFSNENWQNAHNNLINVSTYGLEEKGGLDNGVYGNYWANADGTGYSQSSNCEDSDGNGVCDNAYQLPNGAIDHYPLANINLAGPQTANNPFADCTAISSVPYHITNPGCYYLTADLNSPNATAISISSSNVTLYLNGHSLDAHRSDGGYYYSLDIEGAYDSDGGTNKYYLDNVKVEGGKLLSFIKVRFVNYATFESVVFESANEQLYSDAYPQNIVFLNDTFKVGLSTTSFNSGTFDFSFWYDKFLNVGLPNENFVYADFNNNFFNVSSDAQLNFSADALNNSQYGNYWANADGTGFSQTCTDANNDGICDNAYTLPSGKTDYKPLADISLTYYNAPNNNNGGAENSSSNPSSTTPVIVVDDKTFNTLPINLSTWTSQCGFDGKNYVFCDNFEYSKPIDWLNWWYPTRAWNGSEWVDLGLEYPSQNVKDSSGYPIFPSRALHIRRGIPYNPDTADNSQLGFFSAPPIAHSINLEFYNPFSKQSSECFMYYSGRASAGDGICHRPIASNVGGVWVSFNYYFDDKDVEYVGGDTNYSEPDSLDIDFPAGPFACYPSNDTWNGGWYCTAPYYLFSGVFINHTLYFDDSKYEIFNWSMNAWLSGSGSREIDNIPSGALITFHFYPAKTFYWNGAHHYFGAVGIYVNGQLKYTAQTGFYPNQNVPSSAITPIDRIDAIMLHQRFGNSSYIDNLRIWYDKTNYIEGVLKSSITNSTLPYTDINLYNPLKNKTLSIRTSNTGYFQFNIPSGIYYINVTLPDGKELEMANAKAVKLDYSTNKPVSVESLNPFVAKNGGGRYIFYVSDAKLGATNTDEFITALINKYHLGALTKLILAVVIIAVIVVLLSYFGGFAQMTGLVGGVILFSALGFIPAWVVFILVVGSIAWLVYALFLHGGSSGGGGSL